MNNIALDEAVTMRLEESGVLGDFKAPPALPVP